MLEEEVKIGEQERESLRIETQRLRDELSDLKIESDITHEKLRIAEETIERLHTRNPRQLATDSLRPPSPASEGSASGTTTSSPVAYTPPPSKSETSPSPSTAQTTPPSPPLSDSSAKLTRRRPTNPITPARQRTLNSSATPRTTNATVRAAPRQAPRHSRGPSAPVAGVKTREPNPPPSAARRNMRQSSRLSISSEHSALPRSQSLYKMTTLNQDLRKLTERVHAVRSKLPAPTTTPPRASPRQATLGAIPASVTVRRSGKRVSNSTASSDQQSVSRLSFGLLSKSTSTRPDGFMNPPGGGSRPSSRASVNSAGGANAGNLFARPQSRTGMSGARTPSFHERRPRSSMSGSVSGATSTFGLSDLPRSSTPGPRSGTPGPRLGHGHSQSVSGINLSDDGEGSSFITPRDRRTTLEKGLSAIPTPKGLPVARRQSGGANQILDMGRRPSNIGFSSSVGPGTARPSSRAEGTMPPPPRSRKLNDVGEIGETY
jgi:hypothetical protein